ncbi:hypothetical protein TNCV_4137141 [Trichonephila clavipes]|nr:hypothetical protein TNCV_4137141 [Trichonephila clavipes]
MMFHPYSIGERSGDLAGQCNTMTPYRAYCVRIGSIIRGVATILSAVSMIRGSQATGAPKGVITVPLTRLPYLKKEAEGILIQGPLRASYASVYYNYYLVQTQRAVDYGFFIVLKSF